MPYYVPAYVGFRLEHSDVVRGVSYVLDWRQLSRRPELRVLLPHLRHMGRILHRFGYVLFFDLRQCRADQLCRPHQTAGRWGRLVRRLPCQIAWIIVIIRRLSSSGTSCLTCAIRLWLERPTSERLSGSSRICRVSTTRSTALAS